jgi:hypothetical protein
VPGLCPWVSTSSLKLVCLNLAYPLFQEFFIRLSDSPGATGHRHQLQPNFSCPAYLNPNSEQLTDYVINLIKHLFHFTNNYIRIVKVKREVFQELKIGDIFFWLCPRNWSTKRKPEDAGSYSSTPVRPASCAPTAVSPIGVIEDLSPSSCAANMVFSLMQISKPLGISVTNTLSVGVNLLPMRSRQRAYRLALSQ